LATSASVTQRVGELRAFAGAEAQAQAHGVGHGQDVGEQDGRIQLVAVQRLQRHVGGVLRVGGQAHEAVARRHAGGLVLRQVAAGLAHQPDGGVGGGLAQAGPQEGVVVQRCVHPRIMGGAWGRPGAGPHAGIHQRWRVLTPVNGRPASQSSTTRVAGGRLRRGPQHIGRQHPRAGRRLGQGPRQMRGHAGHGVGAHRLVTLRHHPVQLAQQPARQPLRRGARGIAGHAGLGRAHEHQVPEALAGCGYNDFQRLDEQVKAGWSEVLNQYQRRADLIPNIVATVKGEANFEQETLTKVVEARAKATSIQATPELVNNPEAFNKFQAAQGELTGALSRLLVVTENYPNLKANQASRTCACSSKAPRTASPWRATATSRRCRTTTCWRAASPAT
jgi:hypothetical protein